MYIQSFYIDNFGVFSDKSVEGLSQGLNVFLGKNEAGKSTCLDFLRTMLTGYPHSRSKEAQGRNYATLPKGRIGQAGGSLALSLGEASLVHITRRPDKNRDSLLISDDQGKVLDNSFLDSILSGVTRDVYRNVFGFSLSELQAFESLTDEEVRHALYGASFGMGLRSPTLILKDLESYMTKLFKVKGSTSPINVLLKNIEQIQREIEALKNENLRYDALSQDKIQLEEYVLDLRNKKKDLESKRRDVERKLSSWKQWDEWRSIGSQLARLPEIEDTFPEDGAGRLERAEILRQEHARREQTQRNRYASTKDKIDALVVNTLLLEKRGLLHSLSEHKVAFRQAQQGLFPHSANLQRAKVQLDTYLAELGPEWTCERIHSTNRSLRARSELEAYTAALQMAEQRQLVALTHAENASEVVEDAHKNLSNAQNELAILPFVEILADDEMRINMRRYIDKIESNVASLAEKEQNIEYLYQDFRNTLAPLSLYNDVSSCSTTDLLVRLEKLYAVQDKALALANEAQEAKQKSQEKEQGYSQVKEKEISIRGRLDRMRQHLLKASTTPRLNLNERSQAIRSLRTLHNNYALSKERYSELSERLLNNTPPKPIKSFAMMLIGIIILLCGAGALILPLVYGINSIFITPNLIVPLSQWTGYLVIVIGAVFLIAGMPRPSPEKKRYEQEQKDLTLKAHAMQLELTEMEGQIQEKCVIAEVSKADTNNLDTVELSIENEREKCITAERIQVDIEQLEFEYEEVLELLKQKKEELDLTQQLEQQILMKWHDCLCEQGVDNVISIESAPMFFTRIEAVFASKALMQKNEKELEDLAQERDDCIKKLCSIQAIAQRLYNITSPQVEEVLNVASIVLELCKESDESMALRLRAEMVEQNCLANLELARNQQMDMEAALQVANEGLQEALDNLNNYLKEMGLDAHIAPRMVRAVLECMDKCLITEAEVLRLEEEKARMEQECKAFITPLQEVLLYINRELPKAVEGNLPYQEDWIYILDNLLEELQLSYEASATLKQLEKDLVIQGEELHETVTALYDTESNINHLFKLAKTDNHEEFINFAQVHSQKRELLRAKALLEDTLSLAAGEQDLAEFIDSFSEVEEHECRFTLSQSEQELESLQGLEQEKMQDLAKLTATLDNLSQTDTLAKLCQDESNLQEELASLANKWAEYAVAKQMLLQTKQQFESQRQPEVIRMASDIFTKITNAKWKGLTASLEDNSLHVLSPFGDSISPMLLSRGTQEQLYLSLRLAYIRNHASQAIALPVIMDDVLVNFDPERMEYTSRALLELSQSGKKHQILFFTCHPYIADMLQSISPVTKRFIVERAQIIPA